MDAILGLIVFGFMALTAGGIFFQTVSSTVFSRDGFMGKAVTVVTIYAGQGLPFVAFAMNGVGQSVSGDGQVKHVAVGQGEGEIFQTVAGSAIGVGGGGGGKQAILDDLGEFTAAANADLIALMAGHTGLHAIPLVPGFVDLDVVGGMTRGAGDGRFTLVPFMAGQVGVLVTSFAGGLSLG